MAADIFTKAFTDPRMWQHVTHLIAHMRWGDFLKLFNKGSIPFPEKKTQDVQTVPKEDAAKMDKEYKGMPTHLGPDNDPKNSFSSCCI